MKRLLFLAMLFFSQTVDAQTTGIVTGKVIDQRTGEPLPSATVAIVQSTVTAVSNISGYFHFSDLPVGEYLFLISYTGYFDLQLPVRIIADTVIQVIAVMQPEDRRGEEIVVTASRNFEKLVYSPASIQVIRQKELTQTAGNNVHEMLSQVQGIEFTRYGIDGITVNARGFNSAFNNKVMQLVDGRNSMSALSGNLPIYSTNSGTYSKEDLERVEVVMGPQSALYGPNAHNAVLNFISKDPRKYQGTTLVWTAGNHSQLSGQLRHAVAINTKWAYKLTGEYRAGRELVFYDSVRAGGGNFGPPVNIAERKVNFNYRHLQGEGHLYYSVNAKTSIVFSGGASNNNTLQVTTAGRNQMRSVTYEFLQARFLHPNFYLTAYNTWGNIGNSYSIAGYTSNFWNFTHRMPVPMPPDSAEMVARMLFKERSYRLNLEAQYNYRFEEQKLRLVAGVNVQRERPNGFGINLVDEKERITIWQYGAVTQLEKEWPLRFKTFAAIRMDHHTNFGYFFAPKLALTKQVGNGTWRISWAKAYAMPTIQHQYAGVRRMYFGNSGTGIRYIPNGAPIDDPAHERSTQPLAPEQVNAWECGYKGNITEKLFVDISGYQSVSSNFIGPVMQVYGRALAVNGIAVDPGQPGRLDSNGFLQNALFLANFNYGKVKSIGVDAGFYYQFNRRVELAVKYSWFNSSISKDNPENDANKDGIVTAAERSLNAPKQRGFAKLSFQHLCKGKLYFNISARIVQRYDFYSGNQNGTKQGEGTWVINYDWGPLGGFTSFDMNTGYQIKKNITWSLGISNLFNSKQVEMTASPSIARLIVMQVRIHLPHIKY